jgi:LytS/YehU family sensor histidine kinase
MEGQVRIEEEVALLQNYMAIFQKRFKGRFYATLEVQGTALSQQIEPLLLISFLENAFKHGLTNDPEHPVRFLLEVAPGTLYFSAWNKVKQQHKDPGSGIGLKNIRQRLQLLYPNRHDLVVDAKPDTFAANLRIDLEPDT